MFTSTRMIYNRREYLRTERKKGDEAACKNLSVLRRARVAAIKQPNGFSHLLQGQVPDEALTAMRMHLTTFPASDLTSQIQTALFDYPDLSAFPWTKTIKEKRCPHYLRN